ncbi:MAG: hypothetical protein GC168_09990 [Candidatus Hydrogenedens sp.]|nr:hypothetical protein [Candidatus Hydrogenedens sp.]
MSEKDRYDDAHRKEMGKINKAGDEGISNIPEQFVRGVLGFPKTVVNEFTKTDAEERAERDARSGRYDPPEDKGGCFITTACVDYAGLPDDCYEMQTIRRFRDEHLRRMEGGPEMLEEYYSTAPDVVRNIKNYPSELEALLGTIRCLVRLIEGAQYAEAVNLWQEEFSRLRKSYT